MKTYTDDSTTVTRERRAVGIADTDVATEGETLVAYGLGATVAVPMYEPTNDVGGIAVVMLPSQEDATVDAAAKFADSGIQQLLEEMIDAGANYKDAVGWIVGGSDIFDLPEIEQGVGKRTARVAKEQLEALDIPVIDASVGGTQGRTVEFDTETATVSFRTVDGERTELDTI